MTAATGPLRRAAAWAVHLLTASSAAAGILAVLAAERGAARTALAWMAYTVAVDSIDGTLARALEVKRVLPIVDGTRLDDIVDYFTYVIVPALFLLHADLLPAGAAVPVALCPVLASAVGFSRIDAKTPDHFFTGFPSYWNIVAFYLWALGWPRVANAAVVVAFSIAVFVPIRYVYPSRTRALRPLTVALGLGWGAAVLAVLARPGTPPRAVVLASLGFPVYYALLSFALHASREVR